MKSIALAKVVPYVEGVAKFLKENELDEEVINYLVANNISLYKNYIPDPWKQAMFIWLTTNKDSYKEFINFEEALLDPRGYLKKALYGEEFANYRGIFIDAVDSIMPWVVPVLGTGWFEQEVCYIAEDIKRNSA
jgi:hypothetical protein